MRPRYSHKASHGWSTANSYGLFSNVLSRVTEDYESMNTREAKAAFADRLAIRMNTDLNRAWPFLYEALCLVRDHELWRDSQCLERKDQTFESFEHYLRVTIGQSMETFQALESTHRFAVTCKPELLQATYDNARDSVEVIRQEWARLDAAQRAAVKLWIINQD